MQTIGDLFGVYETKVCNLVRRISSVICDELMQEMIKWPGARQIRQNVIDFQTLKGFPGIVGAIDGSHILIRPPKDHPENYVNRKSFHSIILQAVCDANMHLLNVFCGWPGSVHDARVLKTSEIHWLATNTNDMFPGNPHLLGDAAYLFLTGYLLHSKTMEI